MQLRPHQIDSLVAMQSNTKGQVIVPTGGGKTMCMIEDAIYQFKSAPQTIVVVAPRILLARQLCSEFREMIDIHLMMYCTFIVERQSITLQLTQLVYLFGQQRNVHSIR